MTTGENADAIHETRIGQSHNYRRPGPLVWLPGERDGRSSVCTRRDRSEYLEVEGNKHPNHRVRSRRPARSRCNYQSRLRLLGRADWCRTRFGSSPCRRPFRLAQQADRRTEGVAGPIPDR